VDDVDRFREHLASSGVTITYPPEDMFWGEQGMSAADPDGNGFVVSTD
jgi:uncharacterized glyoxalase superfamily protein PhnB